MTEHPTYRPDPPELARACDMLREIYWREYGRGFREAIANVQRILEQQSPPTDGPNMGVTPTTF